MKIIKNALINSGLTFAYISLIALLFTYLQSAAPKPDSPFSGLAMLLTLVISVAMMGILIFGRPILWYLDGHKKDAVALLGYTLGFLVILLIIIFGMII